MNSHTHHALKNLPHTRALTTHYVCTCLLVSTIGRTQTCHPSIHSFIRNAFTHPPFMHTSLICPSQCMDGCMHSTKMHSCSVRHSAFVHTSSIHRYTILTYKNTYIHPYIPQHSHLFYCYSLVCARSCHEFFRCFVNFCHHEKPYQISMSTYR